MDPFDFASPIDDQERAIRRMYSAVVLQAVDDAIDDIEVVGLTGAVRAFVGWLRSRDGREVLGLAGIEPSEVVVERLSALVAKGVRTNKALTRGPAPQLVDA